LRSQNKVNSKSAYINISFFFISFVLVLRGLIQVFNFATPLSNLYNGMVQFGWGAWTANDTVVILNLVYGLMLIILALYIYGRRRITGDLSGFFWLCLIFGYLGDASAYTYLGYIWGVVEGGGQLWNLLGVGESLYYITLWSFYVLMWVGLLVYCGWNSIKAVLKLRVSVRVISGSGAINDLLAGLYGLIILNILMGVANFILDMDVYGYFGVMFSMGIIRMVYYLMEEVIYILGLVLCLLSMRILLNGGGERCWWFGRIGLILIGLKYGMEIFNEINIEISIVVVLEVLMGVCIGILGLLIKYWGKDLVCDK